MNKGSELVIQLDGVGKGSQPLENFANLRLNIAWKRLILKAVAVKTRGDRKYTLQLRLRKQ